MQKVSDFVQNFEDFAKILRKFAKILPKFCKICSREDDFLVDLEKCCKMRPWLQKSASIQPRTSPGKSDVSWTKAVSYRGGSDRISQAKETEKRQKNERLGNARVELAANRQELAEVVQYIAKLLQDQILA